MIPDQGPDGAAVRRKLVLRLADHARPKSNGGSMRLTAAPTLASGQSA